jgi:hypothetical protein
MIMPKRNRFNNRLSLFSTRTMRFTKTTQKVVSGLWKKKKNKAEAAAKRGKEKIGSEMGSLSLGTAK